MNKDQRNALVIGGVGVGILAILLLSRASGVAGTVGGVDPSTLGGSTGTTGVAGINPVEAFPVDIGGHAIYPPINIPPLPPFAYNAPSNVWGGPNNGSGTIAPDDSDLLRRILAALAGLGGSNGCCAQAPATIYIPSTPMLPPPVPTASVPPPIPTYPPNPILTVRKVSPQQAYAGSGWASDNWNQLPQLI